MSGASSAPPMVRAVIGNPNPGGRTTTVGEAVAAAIVDMLGGAGGATETIELAHIGPHLFEWGNEDVKALTDRVASSTVNVFACPTYKATYTGLLKAFLDNYGNDGLAGTIAVPVMVGGTPRHTLAPGGPSPAAARGVGGIGANPWPLRTRLRDGRPRRRGRVVGQGRRGSTRLTVVSPRGGQTWNTNRGDRLESVTPIRFPPNLSLSNEQVSVADRLKLGVQHHASALTRCVIEARDVVVRIESISVALAVGIDDVTIDGWTEDESPSTGETQISGVKAPIGRSDGKAACPIIGVETRSDIAAVGDVIQMPQLEIQVVGPAVTQHGPRSQVRTLNLDRVEPRDFRPRGRRSNLPPIHPFPQGDLRCHHIRGAPGGPVDVHDADELVFIVGKVKLEEQLKSFRWIRLGRRRQQQGKGGDHDETDGSHGGFLQVC